MAEAIKDDELGRSKHASTPAEHLVHLLTIGWDPASPLIVKYVQEHGLRRELEDWLRLHS